MTATNGKFIVAHLESKKLFHRVREFFIMIIFLCVEKEENDNYIYGRQFIVVDEEWG
jgi:hypothetical protein